MSQNKMVKRPVVGMAKPKGTYLLFCNLKPRHIKALYSCWGLLPRTNEYINLADW